jgi:replication factor A1
MEAVSNSPIVLKKPTLITMKDLRPGTRVTMHVKVENVKITRERMRYEGTVNKSADCLVGDEHGSAILVAKDEQLDVITQGAYVTIRNAHANVVKEHMRIEVDRWSKVEITANKADQAKSVNLTNNLSDIEYELVPVDK